MGKVRIPRVPKEPLKGVGLPSSLYDLVREEAHERRVTMTSILTELVKARYA
jgi:hypothetical protein